MSVVYIVNRYRPSTRSRTDKIDYLHVDVHFWGGEMRTNISFTCGASESHLEWYRNRPDAKIIEVRSVKEAMKLIVASGAVLNKNKIKSRIKYNKTALRTVLGRIALQEQVFEAMA